MLIAQISDFHLTAPGTLFQGDIDTEKLARVAITAMLQLTPRPDVVLLSGDITEHGDAAAYGLSRAILNALPMPVYVIPGNHDDRGALRAAFADHEYLPQAGPLHFAANMGQLRLIGLDCTVPGDHHGALDRAGLDWLDKELAKAPDRPTFIMTHHHPFASGMAYMDDIINRDGAAIGAVMAKYDCIDRLLFGHVHRHFTARCGGTLAVSCPSTASQIALRLDPAAIPGAVMEPPGFLLHDCRPDRTVTHLVPLGEFGPLVELY